MQTKQERDKLIVKDGWVMCPICLRNRRLLRISDETEAVGLPVYCKDCKHEIVLNITKGRSVERRSR